MSKVDKNSGVPLYIQIQEIILNRIRTGQLKPGEPVDSEHELASQLDVSRLTVRRAYIEMTRRHVLFSIHGKGTFVTEGALRDATASPVNRSQRVGNTIAVVFPEVSRFFGPILHSIEEGAKNHGMNITLMFNSSVKAETESINRVIETEDIVGLIITPFRQTKSRGYQIYGAIQHTDVATVMVGKPPFHLHFDSVYCDDVVATYDLIREMHRKGHRRIVWAVDSRGDSEAIAERREGYERASDDLVDSDYRRIIDTATAGWETEMLAELQSALPPTAVCCDSDMSAARIYNVVQPAGIRIPDDLSVTGYDNYELCDTLPVPLSSVDQPKAEMGERSLALLRDQLSRGPSIQRYPEAHHTVFVPRLVERASIRTF